MNKKFQGLSIVVLIAGGVHFGSAFAEMKDTYKIRADQFVRMYLKSGGSIGLYDKSPATLRKMDVIKFSYDYVLPDEIPVIEIQRLAPKIKNGRDIDKWLVVMTLGRVHGQRSVVFLGLPIVDDQVIYLVDHQDASLYDAINLNILREMFFGSLPQKVRKNSG